MINKDLVILFSGGADSVLLLQFAQMLRKNPIALLIDYEQLHIKEFEVARNFLEKNNIEYITVKLRDYNVNSGLTGNGEKNMYEGVHEMNVPARNTIFISIAYGIAESRGIDEVWIGADYSDYEHSFPDCTQEYISRMNKVLEISGVKPIKLYAPLLGFTKEMVLNALERSSGIKKEEIYSGYGEL